MPVRHGADPARRRTPMGDKKPTTKKAGGGKPGK
jgi:hypothetical protein